ncbi:zinc finger matrin-type protein 5 [Pararge aegeria]|uniref:zinc finger matrin-type protein 5 n=1 Tax=Pararge aegeria TaxID=116150 RepID=UPI0019D0A558|nr:zinc finger matrin-type protein 5 [Pararge aegeria]
MGKRYYCDYCDKSMVAAPTIIRTHIKGVVHQKLVSAHYQQFKDPETILKEEGSKKPCSRFFSGDCHFGAICRYSHYTPDQINAMRNYVAAKYNSLNHLSQPSFEDLYQRLQSEKSIKTGLDEQDTVIYDECGVTHVLPWTYSPVFDNYNCLPPSIRRLKSGDFVNACFMQWGLN